MREPKQITAPDPVQRYDHRFDWTDLWRRHEEYWSRESIAQQARFEVEAGGLHVEDNFRIVCDGQIDGKDCLNVIGYAETFKFDTHDGLCASCRRVGAIFPPRIHLTPDGIYAMLDTGPGIVQRPWEYPPEPPPKPGPEEFTPPPPEIA